MLTEVWPAGGPSERLLPELAGLELAELEPAPGLDPVVPLGFELVTALHAVRVLTAATARVIRTPARDGCMAPMLPDRRGRLQLRRRRPRRSTLLGRLNRARSSQHRARQSRTGSMFTGVSVAGDPERRRGVDL